MSRTYQHDRPQWIQGGAEMQMIRDVYPLTHLLTGEAFSNPRACLSNVTRSAGAKGGRWMYKPVTCRRRPGLRRRCWHDGTQSPGVSHLRQAAWAPAWGWRPCGWSEAESGWSWGPRGRLQALLVRKREFPGGGEGDERMRRKGY